MFEICPYDVENTLPLVLSMYTVYRFIKKNLGVSTVVMIQYYND